MELAVAGEGVLRLCHTSPGTIEDVACLSVIEFCKQLPARHALAFRDQHTPHSAHGRKTDCCGFVFLNDTYIGL